MGFIDGSGRTARLPYLGIAIAVRLVSLVAVVAFVRVGDGSQDPTVNPLIIPILGAAAWVTVTNTIRRLHDIGRSGWTVLLLAVPLIGTALSLYLLIAPGDPVHNRYGLPPGGGGISKDEHRQRMELLAAAAGEAYRSRGGSDYLNEDGSYNMDGLQVDGMSSRQQSTS